MHPKEKLDFPLNQLAELLPLSTVRIAQANKNFAERFLKTSDEPVSSLNRWQMLMDSSSWGDHY